MKKVPVAGTTFYENKGAPRRRVGKNRIIDAVFCSPLMMKINYVENLKYFKKRVLDVKCIA